MILENLSSIFPRLRFLEKHYPFQEKVSFSLYSGCLTIKFSLEGIRGRINPSELEEKVSQYEMYSIIKTILNYFHIEIQRFYKMHYSWTRRAIEFEIFLTNEWYVGYAHSLGEKELNTDLPNPATKEYIEEARNKNASFNIKIDPSLIEALEEYQLVQQHWSSASTIDFSIMDSISTSFTQI